MGRQYDINHMNVLLEDINSKFDAILEVVQGTQEQLAHKADKSDIETLGQRLGVVEYSLKRIIQRLDRHDEKLGYYSDKISSLEVSVQALSA